jgi:hypothetical protein
VSRLLHILMLLFMLALCVYGLYCAWYMHGYIGTGHYWSNSWFWKGHATLILLLALRVIEPVMFAARQTEQPR